MADISQLIRYFSETGPVQESTRKVGTEIETFFVDVRGWAISEERSARIMHTLLMWGWQVAAEKNGRITELEGAGDRLLYDLGFPNFEISVAPDERDLLIPRAKSLLQVMYACADMHGAFPVFKPIYESDGNYLAIPDERDAEFLKLDGAKALAPLARISAVQFTFDTCAADAIGQLNKLNAARSDFLAEYPQDAVWREYIRVSDAGYAPDRYGGPVQFDSLEDYCTRLAEHGVKRGTEIIPFKDATLETDEDIALYLRSVWWYFRLRRYGRKLCIEARPLARRTDELLQSQLDMVMKIIN